ncbi:MAG TPA: 30S ribosome-binding factor RbfA [Dehalococcoidales bacterium]|nr:30S ribosome-binding factor RbfA [Dehalococcoidales bacterium]
MSHRIERVNTLILREISELIQHQLRDPRLDEFVTVTEVETSSDLKYAKVFVSCIGGKQQEQKILGVLNSAAGFLRKELARNLKLRHTPELSFHWDNSIEHGDRILRLIDQAREEYKD